MLCYVVFIVVFLVDLHGLSTDIFWVASLAMDMNFTGTLSSNEMQCHDLTHWGRDKMAAIFQTTFSNAFSWMKMHKFRSLKFVPRGPMNNIPALVLIMAWRRPGDKPLSEPMMASLLTHIWVTRPQWVKERVPGYCPSNEYHRDLAYNKGRTWIIMTDQWIVYCEYFGEVWL